MNMNKKPVRLAILISGSGSTMMAVLMAIAARLLTGIVVAVVITSDSTAGGVAKAKRWGIPVEVCNDRDFASPEEFGDALLAILGRYQVDWFAQLGWHPMTPEKVAEAYVGRCLNQHPGSVRHGQPMDFGGRGMFGPRPPFAQFLYFVRRGIKGYLESTVQRVHPRHYDKGVVVKCTRVPISPSDNFNDAKEALLAAEHMTVIAALQDVADGTVTEVTFDDVLVPEEYVKLAKQCRRDARTTYPDG